MRSARILTAAALALGLGAAGTAFAGGHAKLATATTTSTVSSPTRAVPTHFGLGLQADTSQVNGWMAHSNISWDYAYRYIGGGINTGGTKNWTDWAANAIYPIQFAQAANSHGYVPVFSYYTLNAAIGPCAATCPEAQTDLTNLNSPVVMALYYNDFAKLMQRLGTGTYDGIKGYGQDAIVHIEPDLSGYAESAVLSPSAKCYGFCTGTGNNPSLLKASVANSGFALAKSYPNTYRGFNQVLLKLRDTYAPNVRLAIHVSNWATGYDINSATSPTLDATALGTEAGQFAAQSGASWTDGTTSTYDLLFNDVSNKDAGYYTYVLNKPRFCDQSNTVFPNFHRWEDYVRAATTATGRKAIVWQVPMGNQVDLPDNNTPGHYQDNRAEYFFSHMNELKGAGLVGALFGSTTSNATTYWDRMGDGVTNPAPVCNSDGWGNLFVECTHQQAQVSDDDGGYLRFSAQDYYKSPLALQ
jgi:hypothetical protein